MTTPARTGGTPGVDARPLRADAVRNHRKILDAAAQRIAADGLTVGMDDIARTAGVAVGTLYRHFPTKDELIAAVVAAHIAEVVADLEAALARTVAGSPAVDEILEFLERAAAAVAHNHAVKSAAKTLGVAGTSDADEARARDALDQLLRLGQRDGTIRNGLTTDDLYLLMSTTPSDQPAAVRQRWLHLVLPGIVTNH